MKILITGFSGYLGNSFLEVLKKKIGKNDQVFCISSKVIKKKNKLFKYKTLNLNNYKKTNQFIMDFRPDILFHFAWYVEHKDYLCSQKNFSSLNFSNNLYEIFCKLGGKKAFFLVQIWNSTPIAELILKGKLLGKITAIIHCQNLNFIKVF